MSMETTSIHKKLLAFQKQGISIRKSKTNPHFRNEYADINEILGKVIKPLNDLGVVVIQTPDEIGLITTLHDTDSGTEVTGRLNFVGATDAQKLGGNITYYRRYSLIAMLGLEDNDDDGNIAVAPTKPVAAKKPTVTTEKAMEMLGTATSLPALQNVWVSLAETLRNDPEVVAMKDERKEYLTNQESA